MREQDSQGSFKVRKGGVQKQGATASDTRFYTTVDGQASKKGKDVLADFPPFFLDSTTGHVICAGHKKHWTNLSTLKLWIAQIVYLKHVVHCKACGIDPMTAKSIVHIDAYPVHISEVFRAFMRSSYPQLFLAYVPANCTSQMQVADVGLNRPLKADYTDRHMLYLVHEGGKQTWNAARAHCKIQFSDTVSKCAGRAVEWLVASYAKLASTGRSVMLKAFPSIGYYKCCDDPDFCDLAYERKNELFDTASEHLTDESVFRIVQALLVNMMSWRNFTHRRGP